MKSSLLTISFLVLLSSCAGLSTKHGFVNHETKESTYGDLTQWQWIRGTDHDVILTSTCANRYLLSFGPFFGVPLPVLPWPKGIIGSRDHNDMAAELQVSIGRQSKNISSNPASVTVKVGGEVVKLRQATIDADFEFVESSEKFELAMSCKELASKLVNVSLFEGEKLLLEGSFTLQKKIGIRHDEGF